MTLIFCDPVFLSNFIDRPTVQNNDLNNNLREESKDPFKRKLYKLLIKVLETKKVYVDIRTITSSFLNSLFSWRVFLPYIYRCYLLFIYLFIYIYWLKSTSEVSRRGNIET